MLSCSWASGKYYYFAQGEVYYCYHNGDLLFFAMTVDDVSLTISCHGAKYGVDYEPPQGSLLEKFLTKDTIDEAYAELAASIRGTIAE